MATLNKYTYIALLTETVEYTSDEENTSIYNIVVSTDLNFNNIVKTGIEKMKSDVALEFQENGLTVDTAKYYENDVNENLFYKNSYGMDNPLEIAGVQNWNNLYTITYTLSIIRILGE